MQRHLINEKDYPIKRALPQINAESTVVVMGVGGHSRSLAAEKLRVHSLPRGEMNDREIT